MEETCEDMLDIRERAWIRYYKSDHEQFGYNLETGGNLSKHLSDQTRKKLSKSTIGENHWNYGGHHSPDTIRKMKEAAKGRHNSVEARRKMSESHGGGKSWHCGKPKSEAVKKKISKKLMGHPVSKETVEKVRATKLKKRLMKGSK